MSAVTVENVEDSKLLPWLQSGVFDLCFIILPPFFASGFAFFISQQEGRPDQIPLWAWLFFILGIDVSHVYSTLFRTYFNATEVKENRTLFILIPLVVWIVGVFLYTLGSLWFWRILAYVAIFHFARQQYGFVRLYSRHENQLSLERWLDSLIIAFAVLFPIVHWHASLPRNFHWFVENDFVSGLPSVVVTVTGIFYGIIALGYLMTILRRFLLTRTVNWAKLGLVGGTALSWYVGIVLCDDDVAFTSTNVVAHGVPYLALIWLYGKKQAANATVPLIFGRCNYKMFFGKFAWPFFLATVLCFSYFEEGLWAGFIWREHLAVFPLFAALPEIVTKDTLTWLVPLLTLPQATHYVLDGFIWKVKNREAHWQKVMFAPRSWEFTQLK
jgi:hypothetical protein